MNAYVVLHFIPTHTGNFGGVDFYAGRGSVSALSDVARLITAGCRAEDPAIQAQAENMNRLEAERQSAQAADRNTLAALERMPGYLEGKRRRVSHRRRRP